MLPLFLFLYVCLNQISHCRTLFLALWLCSHTFSQCMTLLMDLDMCVECVRLCVWTGWIIRFSKRQMMTADCSTRDRDTPTERMHWKEIVHTHWRKQSLSSRTHTHSPNILTLVFAAWLYGCTHTQTLASKRKHQPSKCWPIRKSTGWQCVHTLYSRILRMRVRVSATKEKYTNESRSETWTRTLTHTHVVRVYWATKRHTYRSMCATICMAPQHVCACVSVAHICDVCYELPAVRN